MRNFGVHFLLCLLISWPGVSLSGGPEERKVRWPRSDSDRYLFKVLGRLMQKDNDLTRRMEVADMIQTMPGKSSEFIVQVFCNLELRKEIFGYFL